MAKNQRYTHADHISLPVPEGTKAGDPVRVGAFAGVAQTDRRPDGTATVWLDGSYMLPVDGALDAGQPVFISDEGTLTATADSAYPFGSAVTAKGSGAGIAEVAPYGNDPSVAVRRPDPEPEA